MPSSHFQGPELPAAKRMSQKPAFHHRLSARLRKWTRSQDAVIVPATHEAIHQSSDPSCKHYAHKPFADDGQRHIRLVKMIEGDTLAATIEHFPLDQAPPYTALSYMWGDNAKPNAIVVNGSTVGVTGSLLGFLKEARNRTETRNKYAPLFAGWLWIDAICINQEDLDERSNQVSFMKEIFEEAKHIIIWLGEGTAGSRDAIEILRRMGTCPHGKLTSCSVKRTPEDVCEFVADSTVVVISRSLLLEMQQILRSPYWSRCWIIQEASTPRPRHDDSTLTCVGGADMPLAVCALANWQFIEAVQGNTLFSDLNPYNLTNMNLHRIYNYSMDRLSGRCIGDLYQTLTDARSSLATDPRDMVYSILGLVDHHNDPTIVPDYTLSAAEVYVNLSRSFITHGASLNFLGAAGLVRKENIPSWAVDWSARKFTPVCFSLREVVHECNHLTHENGESIGRDSNLFNASRNLRSAMDFHTTGRKLSTRGFEFDVVKQLSCARRSRDVETNKVWRRWTAILPEADESYPSGCSVFTAVSQVLKADLQEFTNGYHRGSTMPKFTDLDMNAFAIQDHVLDYTTLFRKLFVTEKGYIGITAETAQVGDIVCILGASSMPMVLRLYGRDEWLFVGQAYVHGIMDGEAVESHDETSERTFCIV